MNFPMLKLNELKNLLTIWIRFFGRRHKFEETIAISGVDKDCIEKYFVSLIRKFSNVILHNYKYSRGTWIDKNEKLLFILMSWNTDNLFDNSKSGEFFVLKRNFLFWKRISTRNYWKLKRTIVFDFLVKIYQSVVIIEFLYAILSGWKETVLETLHLYWFPLFFTLNRFFIKINMGFLLFNNWLFYVKAIALLEIHKPTLCKIISSATLYLNFSKW